MVECGQIQEVRRNNQIHCQTEGDCG